MLHVKYSFSNQRRMHMHTRKVISRIILVLGAGVLIMAACAPQLTGNPARGGQLYDEWWGVLGTEAPVEDQPLWVTQTTNTRSGGETWRCKECHGWDYRQRWRLWLWITPHWFHWCDGDGWEESQRNSRHPERFHQSRPRFFISDG